MLIGRKVEQAALRALVDGAGRNEGGALLLTGDAGIGKTTLPRRTRPRAPQADDEVRRHRADGGPPLRRSLRPPPSHPGAFRRAAAPQAQALRRALGSTRPWAWTTSPCRSPWRAFSWRLSARQPVLVIVDEVQRLDEPSRSALLFVARRLDDLSVAWCSRAGRGSCPRRSTWAADAPARAVAAARRPGRAPGSQDVPIDARVRGALLDVAAGNPLALTELPVALSADHWPASSHWASGARERRPRARVRRQDRPAAGGGARRASRGCRCGA